jgi:hypothetical protein
MEERIVFISFLRVRTLKGNTRISSVIMYSSGKPSYQQNCSPLFYP